jgi:endonuclease YncB( thermonuclease family)
VRRFLLLIIIGVAGFAAALAITAKAPASYATSAWFRSDAVVLNVVDGDTLDARLAGKKERVRLIGIDTPERGVCFFGDATAAAKRLAAGKRVVLIGDNSQDKRDRYGRLLAYVQLPGGQDLARVLVAGGFGRVYVYSRPFARVSTYRTAETAAKDSRLGLWSSCAKTPAPVAAPPPATTTPAPAATVAAPVTPPVTVAVPTTTAATTAAATTPLATTSATTTTAITTPATTTTAVTTTTPAARCDAAYPDFCIPPPPPDLDCKDITWKDFRVLAPDPHRFDGDKDGRGCED